MNIVTMKTFNAALLLSAVSISGSVFASEDATDGAIKDPIAHGEEAHKNHCYKCHTDEVYTRENRFVKSIDALSKQVVRCKEGSDVPWFEEDSDAVVQFLNKKYYRF
ncbi:MAG: cytochrome c [Gammaproteobacteria bacterium]|nr:cytochrome c [Gammaproteobacteria bacterium]